MKQRGFIITDTPDGAKEDLRSVLFNFREGNPQHGSVAEAQGAEVIRLVGFSASESSEKSPDEQGKDGIDPLHVQISYLSH